MNPLFSIITVTYNAAKELPFTIKSVKEQTYTDFEYLIIDGSSKDETLEVAKNSGISNIIIVSEPDNGLYDAMNKGIKQASGKYIIFLNAGDSFSSPKTLSIIAKKAIDTNGDILYGQTQLVNSTRKVIGMRHLTAPESLTFYSLRKGMLVCHQAFIVKRKIAPQFNLKYRFSADYEWCIQCLKLSGKNVYINYIIIDYLTEGLTDKNHKKSLCERFDIMCKYYGTIPTIFRHILFIPRFIKEKYRRKAIVNNI